MSFNIGSYHWSQPYGVSNEPSNTSQSVDASGFDIQLPTFTDQQWARFDNPVYPLPPYGHFNPSFPYGYTYHAQAPYTPPHVPMGINPLQTISTPGPVTYDSPPEHAHSPSIHEDDERAGSGNSSGSITPRAFSPSLHASTTSGISSGGCVQTQHKHNYTPYNINDRKPVLKRNPNAQDFSSASLLESWVSSSAPPTAVLRTSSIQAIRDEMNRLSEKLRELGLSGTRHNPYLRCPVYDCERGGHNPLLHGPLPVSETKVKVEEGTTEEDYAPIGTFFALNEVIRHVRSKHAPEVDLRCDFVGCADQARLDARAGGPGRGRFCRADVLRKHLKRNPMHKDGVSEALKDKYKLWKD
ncbi:hypothetical protein M408DRAFT_302102 [Serendipita vermifera MAFF 305830]|uniref:Uncharacterized protein n=1 Tax=Serendipita vermifera MAFF 305830 TaxID=933852 RepID=A0A0C3AAQ3_SERVB|nr:hypothetical protein M408DRAFT_302102 [Serendipita vermifera MAFF 305830]